MSKIINGVVYIDVFNPTGNAGEYTFDNALYNNQADTGNGAYDIVPGYVIFVQASDTNTLTIIPGLSGRYILTAVTVTDAATFSGTMLWDGVDVETTNPTNGVTSIISQTTTNLKLGVPAIDSFYSELAPGSTLAALLTDTVKVVDNVVINSPHLMRGVIAQSFSFESALVWHVKHNLSSVSFTETVTDSFGERIYAALTIIDSSEFIINFTDPEAGSVNVMFFVNN